MTLLFRIIYAAHASGTHHKLALDALRTLECEGAENWRRLFLANAQTYLEGAKAPDKEFKDFKNHVLHVRDNYWGGAPEKAESWYKLLVRALKDGNWTEVAWTAGILSHYYTDPIHPFHTAQSEAENNIHRAVEWSISKSYDALRARGLAGPQLEIAVGSDEHWLKDLVIAGAETSNRHYETLIARYDFARGVVDPPEGLDDVCRSAIGGLLVYASTGFGKILDRAIAEAGVTPPEVPLTVATVVAALKMPLKWVIKKLEDAADRRQVEAIYDELMATGSVDASLPEDDRQIRDLYDREVKPLRETVQTRDRVRRRESAPRPQGMLPAVARRTQPPAVAPVATAPTVVPEAITPIEATQSDATASAVTSVPVIARQRPEVVETDVAAPSGNALAPVDVVSTAVPAALDPDREPHPFDAHVVKLVASAPVTEPTTRAPRFFLAAGDDIEAAPSIGPRTGQRLRDIGITTVAELLAAEAEAIAELLDTRHITAAAVEDWQCQSRLVMEIPELRGTHAQLLVGAGLRTADDVADADPASVQAAVLRFATTRDGQRILREGAPPDLEKITAWLENARQARAA